MNKNKILLDKIIDRFEEESYKEVRVRILGSGSHDHIALYRLLKGIVETQELIIDILRDNQ